MKQNKYQAKRDSQYKKIKHLKKYFRSSPITLKNFEKNLSKYHQLHNDFMEWRVNFKYPELDYLKRINTVKPLPSDKLISDLAKSICELKKLFIELKDFKAGAIFKLFLNHISQCIKAKYKVKYATKGYFGISPAYSDVTTISSLIVEYFLNIKFEEDDPNAKYSCGCKRTKGYKLFKAYQDLYESDDPNDFSNNHQKYCCKHKKCGTSLSRDPVKPWNDDPEFEIHYSSEGHDQDPKYYKRDVKEFKSLINKKHNRFIYKKNNFGGSPDKVLAVEILIKLFFTTDLFLEDGKIEQFLFDIKPKKEIGKSETRIVLNRTKYDSISNREEITLYWGKTKNNKPHGKGVSETYETDDTNRKVMKDISPLWWKKYSRNLKAKDLVGHIIIEKYEGEWANGKKNGNGVLISYSDPYYGSNKDWTPEIYQKSKGTFKDDELFDGKFEEFGALGSSKIFKNGKEKK